MNDRARHALPHEVPALERALAIAFDSSVRARVQGEIRFYPTWPITDRVTLASGITLTTAAVVVSGGRGVGSADGLLGVRGAASAAAISNRRAQPADRSAYRT